MDLIVFLSYWLFDLRLPALEFVGCWVEPGLGAEMRTSWRLNQEELGNINRPITSDEIETEI